MDNNPWAYGLSKYERASVIAFRVQQLSQGALAKVPIPLHQKIDLYEIAQQELDEGKIDVEVCRKFPDGSIERVPVAEAVLTSKQ